MLLFLALHLAGCQQAERDTGVVDASQVDADADGFTADVDCDDHGAAVNPGAVEACNGVDDDCDGETDELGATGGTPWYLDADGDAYGDLGFPSVACTQPADHVANSADCDDDRADVHPGGPELCDEADNDCDAAVDEDAVDAPSWYTDADDDGFGAGAAIASCAQPAGTVATDDDCDDAAGDVHPGAPEWCDTIDQDCDGATRDDESSDAMTRYADADADGFGDAASTWASCDPVDGFVDDATDCDDTAASVNPAATELCNGADDDCDAEVDEDDAADALTWYADADGDSFGDPEAAYAACAAPAGFVADAADCDDALADVSPDGTERCNTLDDDCDGEVDEASATDAPTWYTDGDGDTYGDAARSERACSAPAGAVADDTDCDDADAATYPGADEYCDGVDDDCDGTTDEPDAVDAPDWYYDADGDSYGDVAYGAACADPGGVVADGGDCDDTDSAIRPGATETCDGVDTNCSGDETDAINATRWFADVDGDGYGDAASVVRDCSQPAGTTNTDTDCDDSLGSVNPGASEVCDNGADDNCSGDADSCWLDGTMSSWDAFVATSGYGAGLALTNSRPQVIDVDDDGIDDMVAGNLNDASGGSAAGAGLVYIGPITDRGTGADVTLVGEDAGDKAGTRVAAVGDLGGSGRPYLAVGAPVTTVSGRASAGTVYLFADVPTSASTLDLSLADARIDGEAYAGLAGSGGLAGVGDVDGDGLDELVIGQSSGGTVSGMVAAFDVASGGSFREADADWTIDGTEANDNFGAEVVGLGDDDGDGLDDFAVSAPYADAGGTNAGAVHVFYGSAITSTSLTAADAGAVLLSSTANPGYGTDLGVGDLDGDGAQDILGGGHSAASAAYVEMGPFYAKGTADLASLDLGLSVYDNGFAGDVDADGTDDLLHGYYYGLLSSQGKVWLTYGPSALGTASMTGWSVEGYADGGSNVTGTLSAPGGGDVNDDGFADVLVPMYAMCATTTVCGGLYQGNYIGIQYGHGQ